MRADDMDRAYLTTGKIVPSISNLMELAETIVRRLAAAVSVLVAYLSLCLLAMPARGAGLEITTVGNLPDCTNGSPWVVTVVDGSSSTDCSTGSGTTEVICTCKDGVIAAVGSGGGSDITLDLADDGSNESTALGEIATDNDDYSVVTEPSADKALFDVAKLPPYQQYDIDRPPSSCAYCDEFTNDTASLTWRWGNQGTATITLVGDAANLVTPVEASGTIRARWTTGADGSSTDWVATAKITVMLRDSFNAGGVFLITAGDETTPTGIKACRIEADGTTLSDYDLATGTWTAYATFSTNNVLLDSGTGGTGPFYVRMRYVSSSKGLTCGFSTDGAMWYEQTTQTLAAHPTTSIGFAGLSNDATYPANVTVHWFRQRTDSTGTTSPYPAGE